MNKPSWWNPAQLVKGGTIDKYGPLGQMLLDHAIRSKDTVFAGSCRGILEDDGEEGQKALLTDLITVTNASTTLTEGPIFGRGTFDSWITWEGGSITIQIGLDGKITAHVTCLDEELYMKIAEKLGEHLLPDHVRQPVYALANGLTGIEIIEVGTAGESFEKKNYMEDVQEGFDFIVSDLQRDPPMGRLVILEGDPGCGKTYFVRGLINEILDAVFVLIPPHLVEGLAGPQLVPTLVRARGMAGSNKPIILIIEDADHALVPREDSPSGLSAISSLLNVSDGILGHALNVRVLCTTNATVEKIDPALNRARRLSKRLHIGPLTKEKAAEVYARITEGEEVEFEEDEVPLAEVYNFAHAAEIEEDEEDDEEEEDDDDDDDDDEDDDDDDDDEDDE